MQANTDEECENIPCVRVLVCPPIAETQLKTCHCRGAEMTTRQSSADVRKGGGVTVENNILLKNTY